MYKTTKDIVKSIDYLSDFPFKSLLRQENIGNFAKNNRVE